MVHPDFWKILDEAAARSFALVLLTNGTLLSERVCDRLASYPGLYYTSLSLYGAVAATHDSVTKVAGSFQRTIEGARGLKSRGVGVQLKFILMKANASEAGAMLDLAEREEIVASIDPTITGRYDGTMTSLTTRVDPQTLEGLYRGPLAGLLERGQRSDLEEDFFCMCARGNAAVSSSGDVYPCIATPLKAGNIREQRFPEIWKHSPVFNRIRGLRVADFKSCAPCGLRPWCRRSPGPPVILHGDFTGIDPWVCREAEILKKIQNGS